VGSIAAHEPAWMTAMAPVGAPTATTLAAVPASPGVSTASPLTVASPTGERVTTATSDPSWAATGPGGATVARARQAARTTGRRRRTGDLRMTGGVMVAGGCQ